MKKAGEILRKTQLVEKAASRAKRKPDPEKEFSLNALTIATQEAPSASAGTPWTKILRQA